MVPPRADRATRRTASGVRKAAPFRRRSQVGDYAFGMLPALRDRRGRPAAPMRLLALLVAVGMLALAAPALVVLANSILDIFR